MGSSSTATLARVVRAIFYPVTEPSVMIPLLVLWLLVSLAKWGGVLGLFLMFLVIPAVFRQLMIVLEARANELVPAVPDVEFFRWFGNAWSLFPVLLAVLAAWGIATASRNWGFSGMVASLALVGAVLPASFAVLAITHSPLQSVNPTALVRLLVRCRSTFWIASLYLMGAGWLILQAASLPSLLDNLLTMLLLASVFSLIGSLIAPYGLMQDVAIPEPLEAGADKISADLETSRLEALNHAYGFVSRGNRDGGFKHIIEMIETDPQPVAAWAWFFDGMLGWERHEHALFFAQHYLHDLLQHGENVPALKLILRCRLLDDRFKPFPEDLPAAILAAKSSGNKELATVLELR